MALADVLKTTITSIYPPVNGLQDHAFLHLNTSFKPSQPIHGTGEILIMWTNTAINDKGYWKPVSLIPNIYSVCDDFNPQFHSTFENCQDSPLPSPFPSCSTHSPMSSSHASSLELHLSVPDSPVDDRRRNDLFDQDNIHTQPIMKLDVVPDFESLPNGKFMSAKEVFLRIKECRRIFEECPAGNKSHEWLLVNNKLNVVRYSKDLKREYYDDCGIWNSKNSRTHIQDYSSIKCIFKRGDSYCTRHVKSGKTVYLPVQPQPGVITMHRYQTVLKSDASFKKHVTYFTSTDDTYLSDIALFEYEGIYRVNESEKLRTNPKTFQNIEDEIKVKPPKNIYVDLNREDSLLGPKDTKQIRNLKYRKAKKTEAPSANVADEILCVLKMLNEHPFVQHVSHHKNKVLQICYIEEQLADLKFFLKNSDSSIIGVDRTFNLGPFFVTCLVYKNNRVLRRETNDHPIFIGPMLLHKDATEVSIEDFEIRFDQSIEFGTDNERAMTKAIEHSFPNATRRLCTKHLKDNIKFYLQNKGVNSKLRKQIMEHIFGDSGLVNADDSITFERLSIEVKSLCGNFEQFVHYFEKVLKERLDTYVFQPQRASNIKSPKLWTNNNAESINRVFKFAINWKPKSTPELIKKLFDCVDYQFMNLRAALHNTGDYMLTTIEKRYLVSENYWRVQTTEQKRSIFLTFLNNKKRKNPPENIISSDEKYQVSTKARDVAKKPCQKNAL
ncbi:hypothetical protein LOTGIDRAFT_166572 [Lottia gigantea]|uniref:MULE transposase domain-containing protein n=1 Tax=Lottia gigantea TaxID=225164 RepID=V3ZSV0_LOTGI|nr:hypothetical protein LOTGIDRAFT_166572 [Lottia gigantea]ESO87422.1 hypothetical protein LOTGIDRAFT_166572 [Lottia gigantea]